MNRPSGTHATHYAPNMASPDIACNQAWTDVLFTTDDPLRVDCQRCTSTETWKLARVRLVLPAVLAS